MDLLRTVENFAVPLALVFAVSTGAPAFAHHISNTQDAFSCKRDDLQNLSDRELGRKILPSMVAVNKVQKEMISSAEVDPDTDSQPQTPGDTKTPEEIGIFQGSGFVIDSQKGYIITNNHVVDDSKNISINLYSKHARNNLGDEFRVRVVGRSPDLDLAVLQLEPKAGVPALPCLPLGDSADMEVGDTVFAAGSPARLYFSLTKGIVSATNRRNVVDKDPHKSMIQTDAAINPGNSGGPLINTNGEIVGVNSYIFNGANNLAFSIDTATLRSSINQIISTGAAKRSTMGAVVMNITAKMAEKRHLANRNGAYIFDVKSNGPAEKAGIQKGDIILNFGGHEITDMDELLTHLTPALPGTPVDVVILRDGKTITKTTVLADRDEQQTPQPVSIQPPAPAPRR